VAELDCGHCQHLYHRPPFQVRPWVLTAAGRAARAASPLDCPLCDRAELPDGLRPSGRSPEWDARSLLPGLRRAHRLANGRWGSLVVHQGSLVFRATVVPPIDRVLEAGAAGPIPPGVEHEIDLDANARVSIEFFEVVPYASRQVTRQAEATASVAEPEPGRDAACWAHLLCPECGAVLTEGHARGCSSTEPNS